MANLALWFVVLVFLGVGVACVVLSGSVVMNSRSISYKTPWAHYSMGWDEVERIEVEPDEPEPYYQAIGTKMALVFAGRDKRLSMLGPNWWHGGDKAEMLGLLESKLEERGIELRRAKSAMWTLPKNAKVR